MRFRYLLVLISFAFSLATAWAQAPVVEAPAVDAASTKAIADDQAKAGENEANAQPAKKDGKYIRVQRNEQNKPLALQTAIVRYRGKPNTPYAGRIVDLVGVVHIGQREYYSAALSLIDWGRIWSILKAYRKTIIPDPRTLALRRTSNAPESPK